MKKWLVIFAALFVAISSYAQDLKTYIPADAMVVLSADGSAILDSTFFRRVIFISTQKTVDDMLKEKGLTLEQAKKQCGTTLIFLKLAATTPTVQLDGGAVVCSSDKDFYKNINTITQQSLDAELKKNAEFLATLQQSGIKVGLTKVEGKNSILLSMQGNPSAQVILTGISNRMFQARLATDKPAEKAMLKPLKQYSALTKKINYKALFSVACDVQAFVKKVPEMQQDPVAASLKIVSVSISENNNDLILQADIEATSPDAANMLHAQMNAVLATLKADPANKALADMMKLNIQGTKVEFRGAFPIDFVINMLVNAAAKNSQKPANTPPAAPAAK